MFGYIEHIKNTRTPHERRAHAMRVAGVVTAFMALVWITSLGFRFTATSGDSSQVAGAAAANSTANNLVVASSTSNY